ncbi:hypothetical protein [Dapis sp. BLCC M172]|uniref:hypothetical protein n=1 Tax=Dapis sp. BLCC M172 TaxID=2975281 RepID=UPI003CE8D6BF
MLKKIADKWEFESEAALEDFVWENLPHLFNLEPLKRQHIVMGEWCDILAVSEVGQLAIIELKNIEDRYVVQQLTRYYENVLAEKPFSQKVNYQKLVRLVAIAPSFHRHNFIDLKYSKLNLEFCLFEIFQEEKSVYFYLKNTGGQILVKLKVPIYEEYIINPEKIPNITLPRLPKGLSLSLESYSSEQKKKILNIREKILRFDERMGEKSNKEIITYGKKKGKGKLCKSIDKFCAGLDEYIQLYLYLPFPTNNGNQRIFKCCLGIISKSPDSDDIIPRIILQSNSKISIYETDEYLKIYEKLTGNIVTSNSLDALLDLALEEWHKRQ